MNQQRQIELARSYRASDIGAANERRRTLSTADAANANATTTNASTGAVHMRLVVVRRLILRHA